MSLAATLPLRLGLSRRGERALLWLLAAAGGIVLIEPSPYEVLFIAAFAYFILRGLVIDGTTYALAVPLALFNLGGLISLVPFLHLAEPVQFMAVSIYLAVTAVFFAAVIGERPLERLDALKRGYIAAAVVASLAGLAGFFDIAGLDELFKLHGRASGTFKDPNVLGAFVILALIYLAQDLLLRRGSRVVNAGLFTVVLLGGLFLSYSRGAWGHFAGSLAMLAVLTFVLAGRHDLRRRILAVTAVGAVAMGLGLAAVLSVEPVRAMFEERASLQQSYDLGENGRFGHQMRSLSELLERPNGHGPLRYRHRFGEDPHNVFINAFTAFGWIGGLAYALLILLTICIGFRTVTIRSPVQTHAIAIWSVLLVQIVEGLLIDTDHWRHWYLMLGLIWGLFGYVRRNGQAAPAAAALRNRS